MGLSCRCSALTLTGSGVVVVAFKSGAKAVFVASGVVSRTVEAEVVWRVAKVVVVGS